MTKDRNNDGVIDEKDKVQRKAAAPKPEKYVDQQQGAINGAAELAPDPSVARAKAPYSGAPLAGAPGGVKSGAKLLEQVKAGIEKGEPIVDAPPATATIRVENADGSATDQIVPNPGVTAPVAQDTSNSQDGGDGKLATD